MARVDGHDLAHPEDVDRLARALFGAPLYDPPPVVHVAATGRRSDGRRVMLKIGPRGPRSEADFFALSLARARSARILTSAENLRAEPDLVHRPPAPLLELLWRWRLDRAMSAEPPTVVVLSRSGAVDPAHPALAGGWPWVLLVPSETAKRLRSAKTFPHKRLMEATFEQPREVPGWLEERLGAGSTLLELGSSSARSLYESPPVPDELLLSSYHGSLPQSAVGGEFPEDVVLGQVFERVHQGPADPSGWSFSRWVRGA